MHGIFLRMPLPVSVGLFLPDGEPRWDPAGADECDFVLMFGTGVQSGGEKKKKSLVKQAGPFLGKVVLSGRRRVRDHLYEHSLS